MDTKTRKTEAMSLLALDMMTDKQRWQLDILTLKQVGWSVKKARSGYYAAYNPAGEIDMGMDIFMSETEGWVWVRKVHPYCTSVDACLLLPIPDGLRWCMWVNPTGQVRAVLVEVLRDAFSEFDDQEREFKTLPIAMLYQFWTADDEDDED